MTEDRPFLFSRAAMRIYSSHPQYDAQALLRYVRFFEDRDLDDIVQRDFGDGLGVEGRRELRPCGIPLHDVDPSGLVRNTQGFTSLRYHLLCDHKTGKPRLRIRLAEQETDEWLAEGEIDPPQVTYANAGLAALCLQLNPQGPVRQHYERVQEAVRALSRTSRFK